MLDILTIVHEFADVQTAARIRQVCRRLGSLIPRPRQYNNPRVGVECEYKVGYNLHRLDGPAKIYKDGGASWYRGGIEHREYHPQHVASYFTFYGVDGANHREVGPSVYGREKLWYFRGMLHRKIGPADDSDGIWCTLGKTHRLDGPAYRDSYVVRGTSHRICKPTRGYWIINDIIIRK